MNSSRQISVSASACQPKKLMVLPVSAGACAKTVSKSIDAGHHEHGEDAEREAEIADAVDDEGLDRGGVGLRLVVPEADQQIAREPDALPAEEQLHEVVGRHQRQHGEGEERQIGEEARPVRILGHVADRIEVHERRDGRHHHQHHGGQRVDAQRPVDLEVARDDPGEQRHARVLVAEADLRQNAIQDSTMAMNRSAVVMSSAGARARGRRLGRACVLVMRRAAWRAPMRAARAGMAWPCVVRMIVASARLAARDGARARRRARSAPAMIAPSSGRKTIA